MGNKNQSEIESAPSWTVEEVVDWLLQNDLGFFMDYVIDHQINGEKLLTLDLKQISTLPGKEVLEPFINNLKSAQQKWSGLSFIKIHGLWNSRCGYCKSGQNTCYGAHAVRLRPVDYEDMMNKGWTRSGTFIYRPVLSLNCCPHYGYRLPVELFQASSSQNRVLKRMQKFLQGHPISAMNEDHDNVPKNKETFVITDIEQVIISMIKQGLLSACQSNSIPLSLDNNPIDIIVRKHIKGNKEVYASPVAMVIEKLTRDHSILDIPAIARPDINEKDGIKKQQKQKIENRSNDIAKILIEHIKPNENISFTFNSGYIQAILSVPTQKNTKKEKNKGKIIIPKDTNLPMPIPHNLQIITEPSSYSDEKYLLYRKFQINIHHEAPDEVTPESFKSFLVDSPLLQEAVPEGIVGPPCGYGSFHMKYYLDGVLVACSVVDFLPNGVNSVYFMWDTDYKDLSLGIYSALKDIEMIKNIPSYKYYYLGWYVHTCPKMNYKSTFKPCELLCPVTHKYVTLDSRVRLLLDLNGYSRLDFESEAFNYRNELVSRNVICKAKNGTQLSGTNPAFYSNAKPQIEDFIDYVGPDLAQKIIVQLK